MVHSQPRFGDKLSDEDKSFDGEFQPDVSCIVFNEVVVSPVSGEVNGLRCWNVLGDGDDASFSELEVEIQ